MRIRTELYNQLREELASLFFTSQGIVALMRQVELPPEKVDLHGAAVQIWDSVLSLADNQEKLQQLTSRVLEQYPNRSVLVTILEKLSDGTAFFSEELIVPFNLTSTKNTIQTFLLYDSVDSAKVKKVRTQLAIAEINELISVFDMQNDIDPGENKIVQWNKQLASSAIILLMLTPDFFGNPENECLKLTYQALTMGKRVVPVLLVDCLWGRIKVLEDLIPLPGNEFVSNWHNQDKAYKTIAEGVEKVALKMKAA